MADPVVGITNGVPTSGTGTITTLGQTLLDGANITQGALADAAVTAGATGSISAKLRSISRDIVANIVLAAGSAIIGKVGIDQTTPGTTNLVALTAETTKAIGVTRTADGSGNLITSTTNAMNVNVSNANSNGQAVMASSAPVTLASNQAYQTGMSPRAFSVAFSTLTRPANTTAYTALDSISDNATAGSVTALTATVSDTNSDPLTLTEILISSTDTGLAGKKIRAYLFNSDPTASTGVGGGDNAAYSQKKAGYIGSMSGLLETGFSDGTVGRLVPSFADGAASPLSNAGANGFIVTAPSAAGKALWIQYQAIDGFTPSASSTTIIGTVRGFQGRAS